MEAAPDRLHPLAPARGHRHPLLWLDDPARRPRPHQRDPGAAGMDHQAAASHVQQVRGDPRPRARFPPVYGVVPHRSAQAHRAPAHRGLPDPGGLPAPGFLRGDPAPVAARHPRRLPPRVLPGHQLLRGAHPRGRLQGARPAHGGLRAGALGLRLALRGRQRLRAPRDLGRSHRRVHQGDGARAPGYCVILRAVVGLIYAFLRLPTELALWTALASTVIGTAAALPLVRGRFPGRDLLNAFVTSPLLLPQILTGVALLQFYTLFKMQATYGALLIGHVVVTTPYVIRTVTATLTHFDLALEEAAQSLGAHPVRAFFEITLGVIKPGVVAGAIFAFAISFDNFTLSLFLTSSKLTPLPIELFAYLKYSFDPTAAAVSAVAIGVALVVVLGIARVLGLEEFTGF